MSLFRPTRHHPSGRPFPGWRILLPVWLPRYERFYDIRLDEYCYGVRVPTVALSIGRALHGVRLGIDWGPVTLGRWTPGDPAPWLARA